MYNDYIERREAKEAGEKALASLREAEKDLGAAGNWGIADMLVKDSLLLTFIKRNKMESARNHMEQAKNDLRTFVKECRDVEGFDSLNLSMGDLLGFADYFFDSVLVDLLVQSKIEEARRQVREAIRRVEALMEKL